MAVSAQIGQQVIRNGNFYDVDGLLTISAPAGYTLESNNVLWSPIRSDNGVDTYVVGSAGWFKVRVDGAVVFQFGLNFVPDYNIESVQVAQYNSEGTSVGGGVTAQGTYAQKTYATGMSYVRVRPLPSSELPLVVVNGDLETETYNWNTIRNIDQTQPCYGMIGNTIVFFLYPQS